MILNRLISSGVLFLVLSVSVLFSQELVINNGETMIYKITGKDGCVREAVSVYGVSEAGSETFYTYTNRDEYSTWDVVTDSKARPVEIAFSSEGNQMNLTFSGEGDVNMRGVWDGEIIDEEGWFSPNVTLENALVARTLDFNSSTKYSFDLLQTDKFPELVPYEMYFKMEGKDKVTVDAGIFDCRKVIFSIKGLGGLFYKAIYYISDDEHRYIVKIDNMPMDCVTELEEFHIPSDANE